MSKTRVRKTLDRLAYASLILDVCIAIITTLSFFDIGDTQRLLIPINYLLTIVVVLSVVMFVVLLFMRAKERQVEKIAEQGPDSRFHRPCALRL